MMRAKWLGVMGAWCAMLGGCSGSDGPGDSDPAVGGGGSTPGAPTVPVAGSGSTPTPTGGGSGGGAGGAAPASNGGNSGGSSAGSAAGPVQSCKTVAEKVVVDATIVVGSGETFDGKCKRYVANPDTVGDGSQKEGQKPVFSLGNGATLINVVLGAPAADGVHTKGDATLKSITWEDVGEDAMTVEGEGTVVLDGGSAQKGADKIFQINAPSTFKVSNFTAKDAGKFIRQNGDTTFTAKVFIDKCDISDMAESIFRTDSSTSTVSMTNTRYSDIGEKLFIGVAESNITQQNNTKY
jgi:pectate lyase C